VCRETGPSTIRLATAADTAAIAAIYAPFCTDSNVTFEEVPPSPRSLSD